jgi:carbon monoxide dehydrogenase subunit G
VWGAIRDPYLVAECVPGARLIEVAGDRLRGEVRASLGPIASLFSGEGRISFNDAERRVEIEGDGRDSRTGTRLSAHAVVRLNELDAATTSAAVTLVKLIMVLSIVGGLPAANPVPCRWHTDAGRSELQMRMSDACGAINETSGRNGGRSGAIIPMSRGR